MNKTTHHSTTVTDSISGRARRAPALRPLRILADPPERIRRAIGSDGVCVLTFDRPGSTANVLDRATLLELDAHLAFLEELAVASGTPPLTRPSGTLSPHRMRGEGRGEGCLWGIYRNCARLRHCIAGRRYASAKR